jgi:lipopolysaccharide/colanic/teichoic acid biosynthesis glycosyltransferase
MIEDAYRVKVLHKTRYDVAKRLFDIMVSAFLLILLSPLLLVVGIAVCVVSHGRVFSRSERIGKDGEPFDLFKFQSRRTDCGMDGPVITDTDESALTWLGYVLRKTKVEWFPELYNVLRGDMSIVGPRPHSKFFVQAIEPKYRQILAAARPGITGPTQLRFRYQRELLRRQSDKRSFYVEVLLPVKARIDARYVQERSVWLDLRLLWRTVVVVTKIFMLRDSNRRRTSGAASDRVRSILNIAKPTVQQVQSAYEMDSACYMRTVPQSS